MKDHTWVDRDLYPFRSKYFETENGNLHYLDEGVGETILFVHGTPTWSFLYRHFIKDLSKEYRCIAIDHLGFGLSDKPVLFDGKPESHSKNLLVFIEQLNLTNITLFVHDFGGPIGLGTAIQIPERIKRIVMFNTWLWETESDPNAKKVGRIVNSWLGRFLYLQLNFSPKVLLKQGFVDRARLNSRIHEHYLMPFPNKRSRHGLLKIAQSLIGSSNWYQAQWECLDALTEKPWLVLWGTEDTFITTDHLSKWRSRLSNVQFHEFDCGHFVQEEKPKESMQILRDFLT